MQPFGGAIIAVVVLHQRRAEHFDLRPVPAGDDIEREAAAGDVIDRGRLLRRHHRMDGRHVRGGEDAGIMRRGADRRGPGKALEARAVEIGDPAESVPAADRHQRLELHRLGDFRQFQRVRPVDLEHAVDGRNGAAAVEIGAEGAELELPVVEDRIGAAALHCAFLPRVWQKLTNAQALWQSARSRAKYRSEQCWSRLCRFSP